MRILDRLKGIRLQKWQKVTLGVMGAVLLIIMWNTWQKGGVPIKVVAATKGDIRATVNASGRVEAKTIPLGAKSVGRVTWMGVEEGDKVQMGSVLLKMDTYDQALRDFRRSEALYDEGLISRKAFEDARLFYQSTFVTAPQSGFISKVLVDAGQVVAPGSPVMTIVDPRDRWIEIQIDQSDLAEVKKGQPVEISCDAYPGKIFPGTVERVVEQAQLKEVAGRVKLDEDDLVFKVRLAIGKDDGKLLSGLSVETAILLGLTPNILMVPRAAIALKGDSMVTYVVWGRVARLRNVKTGARDAQNIEIMSGLTSGEVVAVSNLFKLKDRSRVRIEQ